MQNPSKARLLRGSCAGPLLALSILGLTLAAICLWPKRATPARWIVLRPDGGQPLLQLMRGEFAAARARSTRPLLYIGATWCPPCQVVKTQQQRLREALIGTSIIEVNLADWQNINGLEENGFQIDMIPVFYSVDVNDRAASGWGRNDGQTNELSSILAPLLRSALPKR